MKTIKFVSMDMDNSTEKDLRQWIRQSAKTGSNVHDCGYQGYIHLYQKNGKRLIVKTPAGRGLGRFVRCLMLRNEYRAYKRLSGIDGVPHCYGLIDGRYLVLECIDGVTFRRNRPADHEKFFEKLFSIIEEMHRAGVTHGDLKRKDNLLIFGGQMPYVIDFGVSMFWKTGFAPLNHYLFNLAKKFDYNAWVKLKYGRKFKGVAEDDSKYYNRTSVEKVSRLIKRKYLRIMRRL